MVNKVRPKAFVELNEGLDGRDAYYYVEYRCDTCNRIVREGDIACPECGTFHDWSKKAKIIVKREICWDK